MAGRIRTIKPELMEDAVTAGLSHAAFRLFVGMILLADDHGNLRAAPRWLQGQVFHGADNDKPMAGLLAELAARLVEFYEVEGQQYAHLRGWTKHQRIDNAGKPRLPLPPGCEAREEKRTEGGRERSRWTVVRIGAAPLPTTAANRGEPPRGRGLVRLDLGLDHDLDHEGEAAATTAAPPPPPPLSERAERVATTLREHADLFGALTGTEVEPFVRRIDRELGNVEPASLWRDIESEVAGWVTHARKKREGRAWSPTQTLGEVESFARTRCRERNGKAREERERERNAKKPEARGTDDAHEIKMALDLQRSEAKRRGQGGPTALGDLLAPIAANGVKP